MPIILRQSIEEEGELALWKVTESTEELLDILKKHKVYADVPFFRNPARLAQWLAVRVLFSELGVKQRIVYDELGKPHLEGEGKYVSISHSSDYVAIIVHSRCKVGIDIEISGDRIHRVSHKFVNDFEKRWLSKEHETEQLYILWGAKECAFKIFGLGSVDFKDHMELQPFDFKEKGITEIIFRKNPEPVSYTVYYQYLSNLFITYAIAS